MIEAGGRYFEETLQLLPDMGPRVTCDLEHETPCPILNKFRVCKSMAHPTVIYTEATQKVDEELIKKGAK